LAQKNDAKQDDPVRRVIFKQANRSPSPASPPDIVTSRKEPIKTDNEALKLKIKR